MNLVKGNPMRRLKFMAPVLILLLGGSQTNWAEDTAVPPKLSLADAVVLALDVNVGLKGAREAHQTAQSQLRIAGFKTSYDIGADMSLERTPGESRLSNRIFSSLSYRNLAGTRGTLSLAPFAQGSRRNSLQLSLSHPLVRRKGPLSEKAEQVRRARSGLSIQSRELYRSQQSMVFSVVRAYYDAVKAQEEVKIQERALALVEDTAKRARRLEEERLGRGIDVYRAEVQVAQTKDRLNLQRESARAAVDELMLAIGVGVGQTPELTDTVPDTDVAAPSLEEAIKKALANRPELFTYDERLTDRERDLAIARDELRTGLDLVASFSSFDWESGSISSSLFDQGSFTTGLQFRFPLDRRILREERDTVERQLGILREERSFQVEEIADDVRSAFRALEATSTSLDIFSQNLEVAKQNLHMAERMLEEGEADNRDVLEAQEDLANVESNITSATIDLFLATMALKHATGEDLTTMVSK